MMGLNDPNRLILSRVARALGDLRESLVFVGGCSTGVLVTAIRAQTIRPTDDVDMVVQAATAREYHEVEVLLSERGFVHDMSADAPICRWRYEGYRGRFDAVGEKCAGFCESLVSVGNQFCAMGGIGG